MKLKGIKTIAVLTALTASLGAVSMFVDAGVQKKDLDGILPNPRFEFVKQANAGTDASNVRLRMGEEIMVDTCTGVIYLLKKHGTYGVGMTVLVDADGKPLMKCHEYDCYQKVVLPIKEALEIASRESEKYKWHDLRKDPKDLPVFVAGTSEREYSDAVEVVSDENVYDTAIYVANRASRYSPAHKEKFFLFGDDEVLEGTAWDGAVSNEKIVAWRYVKPFKRGDD